ncbi:hypothetical protein T12_10529, partial [Trichinella patagoniensis]
LSSILVQIPQTQRSIIAGRDEHCTTDETQICNSTHMCTSLDAIDLRLPIHNFNLTTFNKCKMKIQFRTTSLLLDNQIIGPMATTAMNF